MENMSWDIVGYVGAIVVLYSFVIEDIVKLRLVNAIGCVLWVTYGVGIGARPTVIVNSCVLLIHIYWFIKHRKEWLK